MIINENEDIKALLGNNQVSIVIEKLKKRVNSLLDIYPNNVNLKDCEEIIVIVTAKWRDYETNKIHGILSNSEEVRSKNQIILDLLKLNDIIEDVSVIVIKEDVSYFEKNKKENTFQKYLDSYPKGRYKEEAKYLIDEMNWKYACSEYTKERFENYITLKYANHIEEANRKIKECMDWNRIGNSLIISDYEQFVKNFPDGKFATIAKNNIIELTSENEIWENTIKYDEVFSYKIYITNYPNGQYSKLALKKTEEFELWEIVKNENKIIGYDEFIDKYPKSKYRASAEIKMKSIILKRKKIKILSGAVICFSIILFFIISAYYSRQVDYIIKNNIDSGDVYARNNNLDLALKSYNNAYDIKKDDKVKEKIDKVASLVYDRKVKYWWESLPIEMKRGITKNYHLDTSKEHIVKIFESREISFNNFDLSQNIKFIQEMPNISELTLENCSISDLSFLSSFDKLELLICNRNQKITSISPISNLVKLRVLNLQRTGISDISPIKNLKRLKKLYIGETNVKDITIINELDSIIDINIDGLKIDISPLFYLNDLKYCTYSPNDIDKEQMYKLKEQFPRCQFNKPIETDNSNSNKILFGIVIALILVFLIFRQYY